MPHTIQVADVMNHTPLTVGPDLSVERLAQTLLDHSADGAVVVEDDKVIGVVTTTDLVYRDKNLHMPTVVAIMEMVVTLGLDDLHHDMRKMVGKTVRDIMTEKPMMTTPDRPLGDLVSLMVDKRIGVVPVVDEQMALVGTVTRRALLKWIASGRAESSFVKE